MNREQLLTEQAKWQKRLEYWQSEHPEQDTYVIFLVEAFLYIVGFGLLIWAGLYLLLRYPLGFAPREALQIGGCLQAMFAMLMWLLLRERAYRRLDRTRRAMTHKCHRAIETIEQRLRLANEPTDNTFTQNTPE